MKNVLIGSLVLTVLLSGCEDGACCGVDDVPLVENKIDESGNITPIADFEDLEIKKEGEDCTFSADGSLSSDEDGNITSYTWTINETESSTSMKPLDLPVQCTEETNPIACLSVTDNDNAKSLEKCRTIKITQIPPVVIKPKLDPDSDLIPPTAIIDYIEIEDGGAFKFNCNQSYDNDNIDTDNNPATDPKVVDCHWEVFKTKPDGSHETPHMQDGFTKWIAINNYSILHVTLTVTDDDNQTDTITESYELAN